MRPAALAVIGTALGASAGHALRAPFPGTGGDPVLDLIAYHDPGLHTVIRVWYYAAPAVAVVLAGSVCLSVWRVWLQPRARRRGRGRLPAWPASPEDDAPSLVIGELHHPTVPRESERPSWLVVPETGLYTGVLIVGAVGTGKTTACMYPFAQQLLSWQADRAGRRASALVLEVKGDFCYSVRRILDAAGRGGDYLEIGLDGSLQWNPLDDPLLDSYSLAYGVASLINQLFGKSREPFWQQAYTNLVRWIIENDWLEAIVALPLNMFYNTGIATYVWVLTNRKPEHRQGKVQLIDATKWFQSLRKNLGKKNCELGEEDIERICTTFMDFEESERSKIFDNEAFGYWKVTVERRWRLAADLSEARRAQFFAACTEAREEAVGEAVNAVADGIGAGPHRDFGAFENELAKQLRAEARLTLTAARKKRLREALGDRDEAARRVVKRTHGPRSAVEADPLRGLYAVGEGRGRRVVEYEPDTKLRDVEQIRLLEEGGIEGFLEREVLPWAPDAWYVPGTVKVGYEISFNRYFYKPTPMRTLDEIRADIEVVEREAEGLLGGLMGRELRPAHRKLRVYADTFVIGGEVGSISV